jgi:hypothetical protein
MNNTYRSIPLREYEINQELDYYKKALMNAESMRINLTEAYLRFQSWTDLDRIGPVIDFDEEIRCDVVEDNIIKLSMNGHLPFIKKEDKLDLKEYYWKLRDHYIPRLNRVIQRRNPNIKFQEKAFILIVQYFLNNKIRDLDNQFKSYIFNSLRSTQIINGDSWQSVSYMDIGQLDENHSRTEIYVSSISDIQKVLKIANIIN